MAVVVAAAAAVESEEVWSAVGGDVNGRYRWCRTLWLQIYMAHSKELK